MFCPKCGSQLPDGAAFCGSCGTPVAARTAPAAQPAPMPAAAVAAKGAAPARQGRRIVAAVLTIVMLLTALLPWFEPSYELRGYGAVAAGLGNFLSGGSANMNPFAESYAMWQLPQAISDFSQTDTISTVGLFFWVPFILWIVALLLGVLGIAKAFGKTGGKPLLVTSAVFMLLTVVAMGLFLAILFSSDYAASSLPLGLGAGGVMALAALIASIASPNKTKGQ